MYYDALEEIENNIPLKNNSEYDPNHTLITTISSVSDANTFCNTYNHNNGYNGLKLGQRIQINDGVYNAAWIIAGFDLEAGNIAEDGTKNNNGYGICLIPYTYTTKKVKWDEHSSSTLPQIPYINSTIRTQILSTTAINLRNVLGDHLINRNVLLGNSVTLSTINYEQNGTSSYQWTTDYCTLMSPIQLTGSCAFKNIRIDYGSGYNPIFLISNKYDDGEANYKLPLFNYMLLYTYNAFSDTGFWIRAHAGMYKTSSGTSHEAAWYIPSASSIFSTTSINYYDIGDISSRPMIYIR